jgi:hypothetical protein
MVGRDGESAPWHGVNGFGHGGSHWRGAAALSFASDRLWIGAGFVAALVLYLLFMRPARCRVATNNGRPCPWAARGYLGSCKHHQGLKRGLPVVTASGSFGLPGLMWRRPWWLAEASVDAEVGSQ